MTNNLEKAVRKSPFLIRRIAFGVLVLLFAIAGPAQDRARAEVYFTGLRIPLDRVPQPGDPVSFLAEACNSQGGSVYYRFDLVPGYGTDAYDPFDRYTPLQSYGTVNTCTHTFDQAGAYVLVVKASDTQGAPSGAEPIFGGSITVGGESAIAITGLSRHPTGTVQIGDVVTFTASAANFDGGDVYYQFSLIPHYGTDAYDPFNGYTTLQDYSTADSCTYTFNEAGAYVLVVKASATAGPAPGAEPIFGGSIVVHPGPQEEYPIGHTSRTFDASAGSGGDLPVEIYYPAENAGPDAPMASGPFPVLVFAHGYQQSYLDYAYFWEEMVPAGYIVAFLNRLSDSTTIDIDDYALDIVCCLQEMESMGRDPQDSFYGRVANRFALMGHSTGGGAIFSAAARLTEPIASQTLTVVGLASLGRVYGPIGGQDPVDQAVAVAMPALIIEGAKDCITPPATHTQTLYDHLSVDLTRCIVTITQGDHCGFSDARGPGQGICELAESSSCLGFQGSTLPVEDQNRLTIELVRKWIDHFLKDDESAWHDFKNRLGEDRVTYRCDP